MPPGVQSGDSGLRRRASSRRSATGLEPGARPGRRADLRAAFVVALAVAVLAQVPLAANRYFYFWDDSAAEFLPVWHRIGSEVLAGNWQPMLPGMWNGGNFAAEALFGIWNPVVLLDAVITAASGDLLIAAVVIKTQFLVLLALGVFALCREYGARRTAAIAVAVALPFSGFTLYFDASSWIAGLMGFTWTTHFWWSARRHMRGRLHPAVPICFGLLAVTTGNPYGVLGLVVVTTALLIECRLKRDRRAALRLAVVVAVPFSVAALVFFPLVLSSSVTMRNPTSGVANTGFLVPGVGDLLNLSSPAYLPRVVSWHLPFWTVPVAYLAWFVAPLAPWLPWSALRRDARARAGVAVVGLVYLAATLGPSQLWLFRWPLRLVEYAYLAVALLVALALSSAKDPDNPRAPLTHKRRRAAASAAVVVVGAYLSWAAQPDRLATVLTGTLLAAVLVVLMVRWLGSPRTLTAVLVGGTAVVLVFQAFTFPRNLNVTGWQAPHKVSTMEARYGGTYQGNTLMVGDPHADADRYGTRNVWHWLPPGDILQVGKVASLNNYTGVFNMPYMTALCMSYYGATCSTLYPKLWTPTSDFPATPADLLRLQTVVVQTAQTVQPRPTAPRVVASVTPAWQATKVPIRPPYRVPAGAKTLAVPAGWTETRLDARTVVLHRQAPLPWPDGRVSETAGTVHVLADRTDADGVGETIRYTGSGQVVLADLLWPGWRAEADGHRVPVGRSYAGLVRLTLPEARSGGSTLRLTYSPPGYRIGGVLAGFGLACGVVYCGVWSWRRRRRHRQRGSAARDAATVTTASATQPESR